MKIYLASSWRNPDQPAMVEALRAEGHEVYDFRNPPSGTGFGWGQLGKGDPADWSLSDFRNALGVDRAQQGFESDFNAMQWADAIVLLLPCGRSAHLELGWAAGAGKISMIVLSEQQFEPELMYLMVDHICLDQSECLNVLRMRERGRKLLEGLEVGGIRAVIEASDTLRNIDASMNERCDAAEAIEAAFGFEWVPDPDPDEDDEEADESCARVPEQALGVDEPALAAEDEVTP